MKDFYLQMKTAPPTFLREIQKLCKDELLTEYSLQLFVRQHKLPSSAAVDVPWCQMQSKELITCVMAGILQCLDSLKRSSSLCRSYCLVLIIPPTAPVT